MVNKNKAHLLALHIPSVVISNTKVGMCLGKSKTYIWPFAGKT